MKDEHRKLAFWLLPAASTGEFLRSLVNPMAARADGPPFEPHLTLGISDFDDAFDFARLERMQMPGAIELQVESIQHSDEYTKTLFVRFHPTRELLELREAITGESADESDPHLSLLYKTMSATSREELARSIQLPFERVRFDAIKAISTPVPITSAEDVQAWRTLWQRPLMR